MHPFLTRLGVRPDVQHFFKPFYNNDEDGNLLFSYGSDTECYGLAFHRVPETDVLWIAGNRNFSQVRRVFICASAMEAIAYLSIKFSAFNRPDQMLFVAGGVRPGKEQVSWLTRNLPGKLFTLVNGKDILGRVSDLKMAAGICHIPVAVFISDDSVLTHFRSQKLEFSQQAFSLSAFEKKSGLRFRIATEKPKAFDSYFDQLKAKNFNAR
jgi:hypothetical protein